MLPAIKRLLLATTTCLVLATTASSETLSADNVAFHKHAYGNGTLTAGIADFKERAADSQDAQFQLGILQFLHALEGLQQDLYRLGAGNVVFSNRSLRRTVPIFRMPVPENSNPEQASYQESREVLKRFVARLEEAEKTLSGISSPDVATQVDLMKLAVDSNGNNTVEESEKLRNILAAMLVGGRRLNQNTDDITIPLRFDLADSKWLQGYSNLLAGFGKLLLAFDYENTYETSFHTVFGNDANNFGRKLETTKGSPEAIAALQEEIAALQKDIEASTLTKDQRDRQRELNRQSNEIRRDKTLSKEEKTEKRAVFKKELDELNDLRNKNSSLRSEKRNKARRLGQLSSGEFGNGQYESFMEPIAFIHSINWKVEDPQLLKEVRQHWLKVLELNHVTWEFVQKETDNNKEWLPNPQQDSPFPNVQVTQEIIDGWLETVKLGEAVLNGEMLIPSFRFGKGVSMKAFFETAESFDLVAFITGHNSINYVQDGPILEEGQFRSMNRDLRRNLGGFALWFN